MYKLNVLKGKTWRKQHCSIDKQLFKHALNKLQCFVYFFKENWKICLFYKTATVLISYLKFLYSWKDFCSEKNKINSSKTKIFIIKNFLLFHTKFQCMNKWLSFFFFLDTSSLFIFYCIFNSHSFHVFFIDCPYKNYMLLKIIFLSVSFPHFLISSETRFNMFQLEIDAFV